MINFRFVKHLDTFGVTARLHALAPHLWAGVPERGEVNRPEIGMGASILLRGHRDITHENWLHDLPLHDLEPLVGAGEKPYDKPWRTMQRLLRQARDAIMAESIAKQYLSGEMGRAMLSRLDPGSTIFWHDDDGPYHSRHIRFHLPIVTNPGCFLYSGPEQLHLPAGMLTYFNNRVRHSAANWGDLLRVHLIFEMRRLDAPAED